MKIIWLRSDNNASWYSAATLSHSYFFRYSRQYKMNVVDESSLTQLAVNPTDILVLGEQSYSAKTLEWVNLNAENFGKIVLHIYGSVLTSVDWIFGISKNNSNISVVIGSEASFGAFEQVFESGIYYLPFSVMPSQRALTGSPPKNIHRLYYCGRISHFKNVPALLTLFAEFSEHNKDFELHIVGNPDNHNWRNNPSGAFINYTGEVFFETLAQQQTRGVPVFYHGFLQGAAKEELLEGFDSMTSLSTGLEEDFGLSVVEALRRGHPTVATLWGGYRQFAKLQGFFGIGIQYENNQLYIDKLALFNGWLGSRQAKKPEIVTSINKELNYWNSIMPEIENMKAVRIKPEWLHGQKKIYFEQNREHFASNHELVQSFWK